MLTPTKPMRDFCVGRSAKRAPGPLLPKAGLGLTFFRGAEAPDGDENPTFKLVWRCSRMVVVINPADGEKFSFVKIRCAVSEASAKFQNDPVQGYWDGLGGRIGLLYYCFLNHMKSVPLNEHGT